MTTKIRDLPIGLKMGLIVALIILSVSILAMTVFFVHEIRSFQRSERQYRQSMARIIGRNTMAAIDFQDRDAARTTLAALAEDPHIMSAWILLNSGEVFATYVRSPGHGELATTSVAGLTMTAPGAVAEDKAWRLFAPIKTVYPFLVQGEKISTVVLVSDTGELRVRLLVYLGLSCSVVLLAGAIAYLITTRLQRTITGPLSALVTTMERVTASRDYSLRVDYAARDEIGLLAQGFNRMLQEVEHHGEQLVRYQDRLADMIALRTEELHRAKEEAEHAVLRNGVQPAHDDTAAAVTMPQGKVHEGGETCGNSLARLYALMNCIDAEVLFLEEESGSMLANRGAALTLGLDRGLCLDQKAFAEGYEIYRGNARSLHGVDSRHCFDLKGARVRQMEVMLLGSDNIQHYQMINSEPLRDEAGATVEMVFVARDITTQKEAEEVMRHSARRLLESEERLRMNLAAELHDEVGRDLTALHLNSEIINNSMPDELRESLKERIGIVHSLLDDLGGKIANIISELRPPMLDDFGLRTALKWLTGLESMRHDVVVELLVDTAFPRLATAQETALYRIAQEAVTNAIKHSGASTITVELGESDGKVRLEVSDDGSGFDPYSPHGTAKRQSWGLVIMRERAEAVGGTFTLESIPGRGTRIVVELGRE